MLKTMVRKFKLLTVFVLSFYGNTLNYYVTELLRENSDCQQIRKVFPFYEEMASSEDVEVKNLLQITLLEYLWDEKLVFRNALENMQLKTRIMNSDIGAYLKYLWNKRGITFTSGLTRSIKRTHIDTLLQCAQNEHIGNDSLGF